MDDQTRSGAQPSHSTGNVAHRLARGVSVLLLGILAVRAIGAIYRLVLPRALGGGDTAAYGVGLFGVAFTLLQVTAMVSAIGVPASVAERVAGELARAGGAIPREVVSRYLRHASTVGIGATMGSLVAGAYFAVAHDANILFPTLAMAPAFWLSFAAGAYRGGLQGVGAERAFAASQVIEQFVRVAAMVALAILLRPYGVVAAAAGASAGVSVGSAAALLYSIVMWNRIQPPSIELKDSAIATPSLSVRAFLVSAVPATFVIIPIPIFLVLDMIGIPVVAAALGLPATAATQDFGVIAQMAMPVVNLPTIITTAVAVAVVPAVSAAWNNREFAVVRDLSRHALKVAVVVGVPSSVGICLLARPLAEFIFDYQGVDRALVFLAPLIVVHGLQQATSAVIVGLGARRMVLAFLVAGLVAKVITLGILSYALMDLQVSSAASTTLGIGVMLILSIWHLRQTIGGVLLSWTHASRVVLISAAMGGLVALLREGTISVLGNSLGVLVLAAGGGTVYVILLNAVRLVRFSELRGLIQKREGL